MEQQATFPMYESNLIFRQLKSKEKKEKSIVKDKFLFNNS